MFRKSFLRAAAFAAAIVVLSTIALAQTSQVEGTIKLKAEDGSKKPLAGALIDIYRLDIKGHFDVKTDKNGHFIRLGLPVQGTYLFVVSGPAAAPTYMNNVRITQMPTVDVTLDPGDGHALTYEEVQKALGAQKGGGGGQAAAAAKPVSAADKAKADAMQKEQESKVKEGHELQASLDQAMKHFAQGVQLRDAKNYEGALSEFEQANTLDPSKNKAFVEITHKSNAQIAETHYQLGADLYNKKDRNGAKPHFEQAVVAANKAVATAAIAVEDPNTHSDMITYYSILIKDDQVLIEHYGDVARVDEAVSAIDKVEAIDTPQNKSKWEVLRADMYRNAGRTDDAVAAYKKVLAVDPAYADALYGLGLTLIGSSERPQIQEGANTLAEFLAKAPATDPRVPIVKSSLEELKNGLKIEAEKPAAPAKRGKKP